MSDRVISKSGFDYSFDPEACRECTGNCCTGESGYIWVAVQKIPEMAAYLGIDNSEFIKKFLKKGGYRYSIKEIQRAEGEYDCIFFDRTILGCMIYPVRPLQCRTFPFWDYFKDNEEELRNECPGICRA